MTFDSWDELAYSSYSVYKYIRDQNVLQMVSFALIKLI